MKNNNSRSIELVYEGVRPREPKYAPNGNLALPFKAGQRGPLMLGPEVVRKVDSVPIDASKWSDPPHLAFANTDFSDRRRLELFIKQYGISGTFCGCDYAADEWFIDPAAIERRQQLLRRVWGDPVRSDYAGTLPEPQGPLGVVAYRGNEDLWFHARTLTVDLRGRLVASDLWTYTCVRFLADRADGLTKVCEFDGCKFLRYFIKDRRDQRFCSKQCRALKNMADWRADPNNLTREKKTRKKRYARQRGEEAAANGNPEA